MNKYGTLRLDNPTLYSVWRGMMDRCLNPKCTVYPSYGGKGLTVCDRWMSFPAFVEDMHPRPLGLSIDRLRNDRGYCRKNCRWATASEQIRNSSRVKEPFIEGETTRDRKSRLHRIWRLKNLKHRQEQWVKWSAKHRNERLKYHKAYDLKRRHP